MSDILGYITVAACLLAMLAIPVLAIRSMARGRLTDDKSAGVAGRVGPALRELDRFTQPSFEHVQEAEETPIEGQRHGGE